MRKRRRPLLLVEELEGRALLSAATLVAAVPLAFTGGQGVAFRATSTDVTLYSFTLTQPSRVSSRVATVAGDTRLSLLHPDGSVLAQSDGLTLTDRDDRIDMHLTASPAGTTYYFRLEPLGAAAAGTLIVDVAAATPPLTRLPTGSGPLSKVGDLNRDGILDVVTANYTSGDVSVLLGTGDGTFRPELRLPAGVGANDIVLADLDGDGNPDLATANYEEASVSFLKGRGDGTFDPTVRLLGGQVPASLASGDFNRDGMADLAVSDFATNEIVIFLGQGGGQFTSPRKFAVGGSPYYVTAGDVNGDGVLDLASANSTSNDVSILLGNGDGTFRPAPPLTAGTNPYTLLMSDLDGDGRLDLVSANVGSNDVSVFFGQGDGSFADQLVIPTGLGASMASAGDVNEDGFLDLVVTNWDAGTLSVLLGRAGRGFVPTGPLNVGSSPAFLDLRDLNRDGHLDVVHSNYSGGNVSVLLGRGDGTFVMPPLAEQGAGTYAVLTGDLDGDGRQDLVSINYGPADVLVMLGRTDGTYLHYARYKNGSDPTTGALADVSGDGVLDLVLCNLSTGDISVSRGNGDGSFAEPVLFTVGSVPSGVVAGDYDGDGWLDLAVANRGESTLTLLLGDGAGSLQAGRALQTGDGPAAVVKGDFDRDGRLDLATADSRAGTVSVLRGNGNGTFAVPVVLPAGPNPTSLVVSDLDNDGWLDFAVTNFGADAVSVLLARPGLSSGYAPRAVETAGSGAFGLAAGDFDADGRLDLAVSNRSGDSVGLLLGDGLGGFQSGPVLAAGKTPLYLAAADLNRDGRDDLVVANYDSNDVTVYLGGSLGVPRFVPMAGTDGGVALLDVNGDGFVDGIGASPLTDFVFIGIGGGDRLLTAESAIHVPGAPSAVTLGDFNGDGRPDFAVTTLRGNRLHVFLGRGDGTFTPGASYAVGQRPLGLISADLDRDGRLDLVSANDGSGDVSILFGRGDGSFEAQVRLTTGDGARAIVAVDLDRDGRLDLAVANEFGRSLTVLYARASRTFVPRNLQLAAAPRSLAAGDVTGDSRPDLVLASPSEGLVQVLANTGSWLTAGPLLPVPLGPSSLALGDYDRDGRLDLAVTRLQGDDIFIARGNGDGTFQPSETAPTGRYPIYVAALDITRDGRTDLFYVNSMGESFSVHIGQGDGTFTARSLAAFAVTGTPAVADFNGDGVRDVASLQQTGVILARLGDRIGDVAFAPPVEVNAGADRAARDFAVARVGGQALVAAADSRSNSLSLYSWNPASHTFLRRTTLNVPGSMPVRILAGDVNADGLDDLLATTASGKLFVWLQSAGGGFAAAPYEVHVGVAPVFLALVPQPGVDRPAIAVLDSVSGDVRVLPNQPGSSFLEQLRYRVGEGLASLVQAGNRQYLTSPDHPIALVSGQFAGDGHTDLLLVNQGAHSLSTLVGTGEGFLNPGSPTSLPLGGVPVAATSRDFNLDGNADLVVLDGQTGSLTVYLSDGRGGFVELPAHPAVGQAPTGLTTSDLDGDGKLDLVVGNAAGDVLSLMGNGDGTFQAYRRVDRRLALAVADLDGDGRDDFVFANQALDRVAVRFSGTTNSFAQERDDGILDPGRVRLADLDRDGHPDLCVVNGGGNNVLVYPGLPGGMFGAAASFFAGTNPAGLTVCDLNNDGRLDLVLANEGSNDVSILLGHGDAAGWSLTPGPRLSVGAGPRTTLVQDLTGDGIPDLLVANTGGGTVTLLRGVGGGFFADQDPVIFPTGARPMELAVGQFDGRPGLDLVTLDRGADELSLFSGLTTNRKAIHTGKDSVAMLAGDFNLDGYGDLVVVSCCDQEASLYTGGLDGPQLAAVLGVPSPIHPGDVALAAVGAGALEVYVLLESQEVMRLTFVLDAGESPLPTPEADGPGVVVSNFSALGRSLLEGVPTLTLAHEGTLGSSVAGWLLPEGEPTATSLEMPTCGGGEDVPEEDWLPDEAVVAFSESGGRRTDAEGPSDEQIRLNSFLLGLEDLPFERRLQDGLAREREEPPQALETIDEAFRDWWGLPSAFGMPRPEADGAPQVGVEPPLAELSEEVEAGDSLFDPSLILILTPFALARAPVGRRRTRRLTA